MDWRDLAGEVIAYRDAKGFTPTTWVDLPVRLSCLHSEARELEDALGAFARARAPFGGSAERNVRREMADLVCYALTIMHDLDTPNWDLRRSYFGGAPKLCSPSELTRPLRGHVDDAFRAWRRDNLKDALVCVELVIACVVDIHARVLAGGDVAAVGVFFDVREKIAASADCPQRHGGKNPRS